MAIQLRDLETYLVDAGLKYSMHDGYMHTSFATDVYRNQEGLASLFIIVRLEEDGEYFKLIAPNLYSFPPDGPNGRTVFRVLLGVCWRTKLIKFEYDELDGEIRGIIEFPLEDAKLTQRQFLRCLNGMVQILDEYHPAIASALAGGPGSLDAAETLSDNLRRAEKLYRLSGIEKPSRPASASDLILEE